MFDLLFTTNKKNAHQLKDEYGFDEYDKAHILAYFWPILVDNNIDPEDFGNRLYKLKDEFFAVYQQFDLKLFQKRYDLNRCRHQLMLIKKALSSGQILVWDFRKKDYFLQLNLERDTPSAQTLIISKKDEIGFELLINQFISVIDSFIKSCEHYDKKTPKLNRALISFNNSETIERLHSELKGYFPNKENEFKKALKGHLLQEPLLFPHQQNKFVEVFKRLKYNGYLINTPKEINTWICSNFSYQYQRGDKKEVRNFNYSSVHDILTKDKGEVTKKERICNVDWLPYKSHLSRKREAEEENI